MLIADGIGIIIGVVLCKRIPERMIKLISAAVFIFFGFIGSYQVAFMNLHMNVGGLIATMVSLLVITGTIAYYLIKKDKNDSLENSEVESSEDSSQ